MVIKMKILFTGEYFRNNGPENVNRSLVSSMIKDKDFMCIKSRNRWGKRCEMAIKCLMADVVVVSGLFGGCRFALNVAKIIRRKTVYIMHGCMEYEANANCILDEKAIGLEHCIMKNADLILAVSEKFMLWVQKEYPQYASKVGFLNNGIVKPDLDNLDFRKISGSIIAVGGDRNTKNNYVIGEAVNSLEGAVHLDVYGDIQGGFIPDGGKHTSYKGIVPTNELYAHMARAELFVLNSIFEPFSLSVVDALNCKCSVLLSEAAGITGLLQLTEFDIIHDPNDREELKRKIEYLMEHPNYERVAASLDYDSHSYEKAVERLKQLCVDMVSA